MTTVVVVGSVNLDLVVQVPRLPAAGETVLGGDVVRCPGGKGANQAAAVARLGSHAVLLAAVGGDAVGAELSEALAASSVDVSGLTTIPGASTGVAMVVVDEEGANTVTVAPGANRHLPAPETLPAAHVLLLQLETPITTSVAAGHAARRSGTLVLLNAAPAPRPEEVVELLTVVDVLVVNETEARALAGGTPDDCAALAHALTGLGPSAVVVTAGARGAALATGGTSVWQPAFAVPAVDPTGAGDAFCAALAVALARGDDLRAAVRFGCAAGALAATKLGAQAALPTEADVLDLLGRQP